MAAISVDWDPTAVKNTPRRRVRNRTSERNRPETQDRRVQRTKTSLHGALLELAREKPYPSIAVKDILDRANVGRSTFYTHFRDKHDLLESGILDVLRSMHRQPPSSSRLERILAFSLPVLQHIDEHRRAAGATMVREGRLVMHEHLLDVLTNLLTDQLAATAVSRSDPIIPSDVAARYVASTFVLILNEWVDNDRPWTPAAADDRFRRLVVPTLTTLLSDAD